MENQAPGLGTTITEGKAEITVENTKVFYNPVQEFNRDLSIAVLSLFAKATYHESIKEEAISNGVNSPLTPKSPDVSNGASGTVPGIQNEKGISILEALSATGLRSIRYAKEVPLIKKIVANDISKKAVESIRKNITLNKMEDLITVSHEDATMVMYQSRSRHNRFDAVDLDPYGCPSQFLDGAVQCVSNGGLLLVTATDMAVLAGNSPETCYVKYGAVSLKSKACHELALRILLQNIASHAGRYGRYIEPVLSISVDFYIRVFVRVFNGQEKCKNNTSKLGMVYKCVGCESMAIQPLGTNINGSFKLPAGPPVAQLCKYCQHRHQIGGPIWIGPIHNQSFVTELLDNVEAMGLGTMKRIQGVLSVVQEELDVPLYYVLDRIMSIIKCDTPSIIKFRSALLNAGYNVSFSHAHKLSIKTDAPVSVIWDIARAWEKIHPAKRERLDKNSAALAILTADNSADISFDLHPSANPDSRKNHMARFQLNPTPNWGPGTRSTTIVHHSQNVSKKRKNQNKKSKKNNNPVQSDKSIHPTICRPDSPPSKQAKNDL